MSKPRPKTGERREVRQPLKIDKLPAEMQDRIRKERCSGKTWLQIEAESPSWKEWEKCAAKAVELFPGKRLPHSNLQRWYDVRIEQVMQEVEAESARAKTIADSFAARSFTDMTESAKNALG